MNLACVECERILRELRASFQIDHDEVRRRLLETAESSGRDAEQMRTAWVYSLARMPTEEIPTLLRAHYPTVAEPRRQKAEHEAATGHSVYLNGWRASLS